MLVSDPTTAHTSSTLHAVLDFEQRHFDAADDPDDATHADASTTPDDATNATTDADVSTVVSII